MRGERWNEVGTGKGPAAYPSGSSLLELRRALQRMAEALAHGHGREPRAAARAAVGAYVARLRAEGMPPQRVLVLMKETVRSVAPPDLASSELREVMDDVVRWSIDAFYAA